MEARQVILREERSESGSHHLRARVETNGDVVIEGQDLGATPERLWGSREYEWAITISADSVPDLVAAYGGLPGDDPLEVLDELRATTSFLDESGVPYRFWSRVGD